MLIYGGWGARDSDLRYTRNVFSQPHGFSCIDYISVFIREKNPQKLLKNWDYKPAEVPKSDFQERVAVQNSWGTWDPRDNLPNHPQNPEHPRRQRCPHQPGTKDLEAAAQCHHIRLCV